MNPIRKFLTASSPQSHEAARLPEKGQNNNRSGMCGDRSRFGLDPTGCFSD
jgi:hypothetical protein